MKKSTSNKNNKISAKQRFVQFVCLFLCFTLLANSTPAAPALLTVSVGEFSQSARFALLSSGLANYFSNWSLGIFAPVAKTSISDPVSRIQIYPGSVTIKQDTKLVLSAVAYDSQDEPINGSAFEWSAIHEKKGARSRRFSNGIFEAMVPGTFKIVAESAGERAEVMVTVTPRESEASVEVEPFPVSSRSLPGQRPGAGNDKETDLTPETDEGGWGNGNWQTGDDPGNTPGNPPGQPADDGAGSGNFQFSAPVISLPGRGTDLGLNLNYNSRVWNKAGTQLTYDIDRNFPAPGWTLGFGEIAYMGPQGGCMLVDAEGTRHGYSGQVWNYSYASRFNGHTTDGTFVDYDCYVTWGYHSSATAKFANGTQVTYSSPGPANHHMYPTMITDVQGNFINITYRNNQGPSIETITDTAGRVITFQYDSLDRLISVKAPRMQNEDPSYGAGNTRTLLKIHYKPLTLNYSFAYGITPVVANPTPYVIDSIYYPGTNTGYWFNDADSYSSYGMIAKVMEQRGMSWSTGAEEQGVITAGSMTKQAVYNYPLTVANEPGHTNGVGLSDAPTYGTLAESWAGADVVDPMVTTYNIQQNASPRTTTIIQPTGVVSKQYSHNNPGQFNDGLIYLDETYAPDPNGITIPNAPGTFKLVSKSNVTWAVGDYESPRPTNAELFNENNEKVSTQYDYTGGRFNQITKSCDYDNGGNKLRCAVTQYENSIYYTGEPSIPYYNYFGRHIFSLVKATGIENPDGARASWTEYEYDNYQNNPLVDTPGAVQHLESHNPNNTSTYECNLQIICVEWSADGTVCIREEWIYDQCSIFDPLTDYRGNVTKTKTYTDAQNLAGEISESKSYDITGNLIKVSSSCCEQISFAFDDPNTPGVDTQYAYQLSQTRGSADPNSPNRIKTYTDYDSRTGLIKQETDANGRTSTTMYNPDTLQRVKAISSTGSYTTFLNDDTAMTITEEMKEANGNVAGKTIKRLNGMGLIRKEESLVPGNLWDIVETRYDKYADEWKQSNPYRAGDTPQFSEKIYDAQRRLIKIVEADGSETKSFYNETQRPDSASALLGNTIRVVDAWGRERWTRYDRRDRLVEVVEPNPDGTGSVFEAGSLATKYSYDAVGRLVETEQGVQHRYFKYDSIGRLTRQKLAEQTATLDDNGVYVGAGNQNAHWGEAFWYDTRSNMTLKTDARGVKTHFSYQVSGVDDPLNRIQSRFYDLSGPLDPNLIIHAAPGVGYEYMTSGDKMRIKKIRTDGILTEDYSYDVEGRISDYSQTVDYRQNYPMVVSYLYDSLNRVTDVRYPAQYGLAGSPRKLLQNSYDVASRLTSLKMGGQQIAGNISYDASDQTTSLKVGPTGANQVTESYTFDPQTGLLTSQKVENSSETLLDLNYEYDRNDSAGNLYGKTGHLTRISNNLDGNKDREYKYDALGRLAYASGGSHRSLAWFQEYTYDRYGNRTSVNAGLGESANTKDPVPDGFPAVSFNTNNNRISSPGFEYDSAGNQTRALAEDGATWLRYQYDAANRLQVITNDSGASLQAFQFGSSNARLMDYDFAISRLKIFSSIGATMLAEYTEFSATVQTWTKSYVFLGERLLSTLSANGQGGEYVEYDHPDRLGTRIVTDQAAGTFFEQTTLPFGTALNAESSGSTSRRFTSYERSARTGLDYAINRTYDSKLGRFTQVDPIGIKAVDLMNPQTLNLFAYCANDPINHLDPDGLSWFGNFFKKIFKVLKTVQSIIRKILRVAATIAALVVLVINPVAGLILLAISMAQQIMGIVATTIWRNIKESIRQNGFSLRSLFSGLWKGIKQSFEFLKAIVTRSLKDWFIPVYGYWCAPGWGIDGPSSDQPPVDELDAACKKHDEDMRRVDEMLRRGEITKKQAKRLKTKYDLEFMRKALAADAKFGNAMYGAILQIAFFFRIVFRGA